MAETLHWRHLPVGNGRAFARAETGDGLLSIRPPCGLEPCAVEFAPAGASWATGVGYVLGRETGEALFDLAPDLARDLAPGAAPEAVAAAAGFVVRHVLTGWAGRTTIMVRDATGGHFEVHVSPVHVSLSFERPGEGGCRNILMLTTRSRDSDEPVPAALPARIGGLAGAAALAVEAMRRYEASGATLREDPRLAAARAADEADDDGDDDE